MGSELFDDFERQKKGRVSVEIGSILSTHIEDTCVDGRRLAGDDPALVADANQLAGRER